MSHIANTQVLLCKANTIYQYRANTKLADDVNGYERNGNRKGKPVSMKDFKYHTA